APIHERLLYFPCILLFRPFFLTCCCLSRTLRSFPTRRSSDLRSSCQVVVLPEREPGDAVASAAVVPRSAGASRPSGARQTPRRSDRKSTRLNSSHVKISYAVFCLKKKKDQIDDCPDFPH